MPMGSLITSDGEVVVRRRIAVDDDQTRSRLCGHCAERSRRFDGQRAADGEHQVAAGRGADGRGQYRAIQRLAEHDRRGLEHAATSLARRISLACPDPAERRVHLAAFAAADADDPVHRAVQLEHAFVRRPGPLVEAVDVLSDHPGVDRRAESRERRVSGVRDRGPRWMREPGLPGPAAQGGITDVGIVGGQPLGCRVARPQTLRAAEVRDAGVGGDAGAGQRGDAGRARGPGRSVVHRLIVVDGLGRRQTGRVSAGSTVSHVGHGTAGGAQTLGGRHRDQGHDQPAPQVRAAAYRTGQAPWPSHTGTTDSTDTASTSSHAAVTPDDLASAAR